MEYIILRPITLSALFAELLRGKDQDTSCVVRQFVIIARMISHGINSPIDLSFFTEHSADYPDWVPWLVRHGFIEEKKEEKRLYAVGQRLWHRTLGEYLIVQVARSQINLIRLKSGNRWAEKPITVGHPDKITEDEMKYFACWGEFLDERPYEYD